MKSSPRSRSAFALHWIKTDFHMLPQTSKVNYCIYINAALPGPSLERKHLPDIFRDDPLMAPPKDAGEDIAIRRRRLRYRAWHRGTKEMDLVLGPFADAHLEGCGPSELDRLEALMDEEDTDLLKWVMGQEPVPGCADSELLDRIIAYRLKTP
jgi:antitoxin CptB